MKPNKFASKLQKNLKLQIIYKKKKFTKKFIKLRELKKKNQSKEKVARKKSIRLRKFT